MLEDQLLAEFATRLLAECEAKRDELGNDVPLLPDSALADVFLEYLSEAGMLSEYELCPHEDVSGHRRCRVIGYSFAEDSPRLTILTSLYFESNGLPAISKEELGRLTGWAARFFEYSAKKDFLRFKGNQPALTAAKYIHDSLQRIEDVRIIAMTNALASERGVNDIEILGRPVEFDVWDIERLYRIVGEEVTRDVIDIDFVKLLGRPIACLEMKPPPSEYQTFLAILPGNIVSDLYQQYGARLFELNVRSFLQVKGTVNKGIRQTIEKQPERFLAYNNGLAATADEIEVVTFHGETAIKRLKGLQIVNGAQTTASIHRAKKIDKINVDSIAVAMKLTLVQPDRLNEFVPLIAQFANTQNPIQMADLSASDQFHQSFESLSEQVWCPGEESRWFYERARGSYQVARLRQGTTPARRREFDETFPKAQYFGKTDLAKFLMSWWGHPQTVSKGAQKNYSAFMFAIRDQLGTGWIPDKQFYKETIGKALIFKAAKAAVRKAKLPSYGANVVAYAVAKLAADQGSSIDWELLWDTQDVSPELMSLLIAWAPQIHERIVQTAGSRNVTEWCKKDGCWDSVRSLVLANVQELPPEIDAPFNDSTPRAPANGVDPIKECLALDGQSWTKIVAWAATTNSVEDYDRRVAHTLSGYALSRWSKVPSLKQAIRGSRIILAARKAGAIQP